MVEFFRGKGQKLGNTLGVNPYYKWNSSGENRDFMEFQSSGVSAFFVKFFRGKPISYGSLQELTLFNGIL